MVKFPLATMRSSVLRELTIAVLILTVSQNGLVNSQECGQQSPGSCCQASGQTCGSGYYRDDTCEFITTTETGLEISNTTNTTLDEDTTTDQLMSSTETPVTDDGNSTTAESANSTRSTSSQLPIFCRRCASNCLRCNESACHECSSGYELKDGGCEKEKGGNSLPIGAIAGGVAGGVVFLIVVIVVAVFCCRRYRRRSDKSGTQNMDSRLEDRNRLNTKEEDSVEENSGGESEPSTRRRPMHVNYVNTAFVDETMATKIEQGQDNVLRYTRDPTVKKISVDEQIYENQVIVEAATIKALGEAPPPPTAQQQKKKKKKTTTSHDEGEEEEVYENTLSNRKNYKIDGQEECDKEPAHEGDEQEVYYNDGAEQETGEELYVNYKPGAAT